MFTSAAAVIQPEGRISLDAEALIKALVSLPLLGIAYYFGSEARTHMESRRRAREIAVRLRTLDAFTASLDEVERATVRGQFGQAVFGSVELAQPPDGPLPGKDYADVVTALASAVRGLASPNLK